MQKDELIQFHTFLFQLKTHLDDMVDNNSGLEFQSYDKLNVTPYQVYKSKREHNLAVFELSKGITTLLQENNCSVFQGIYDDLEKMCNRFRK